MSGAGRDQVEAHLAEIAPAALAVVQEEQLGSGHAAEVALAAVPDLEGSVLVVNGDAPLLTDRQREYLVLILLLAAFGFLTLAFVNGSFTVNGGAVLSLLCAVAALFVADPLRRRGRR